MFYISSVYFLISDAFVDFFIFHICLIQHKSCNLAIRTSLHCKQQRFSLFHRYIFFCNNPLCFKCLRERSYNFFQMKISYFPVSFCHLIHLSQRPPFTNHEPIVALRETFVNSTNKLYIVCFWFYISIYCYIPHGSTFGTQGLITSANACISAFSHPFISSPINSLESTKDCKKYFSPPRIHRPISSNDSHV